MTECMPRSLAITLTKMANDSPYREIVGVIFRNWTIRPLDNVHRAPLSNFAVDPDVLIALMRDEMDNILGAYHSHPSGDPQPSDTDCVVWGYPMFRYWTVTRDDVYEWEIQDGYAAPLDRFGSRGAFGLAYPILASAETVRR
jgi:desampylase